MKLGYFRSFIVTVMVIFPSVCAAWQPWSVQDQYRIYWGDFNSVENGIDGYFDLLLIPKDKIRIISSPISFPVSVNSGLDPIMLCGDVTGNFHDCTLATGFSRRGLSESDEFDFRIIDIDGDGSLDIFIHSKNPAVNSIFMVNEQNGTRIRSQFTHINGHAVSGAGEVIFEADEYGRNKILTTSSGYRASWNGLAFGAAPAAGVNYSLVGASAGTFSVNNGRAEYSIPINLVPGGAGVNPSFSLSYSSGADYGHAGMGFSLSLVSSIERCGRSYLREGFVQGVRGNTDDMACLDGNRLLLVRGDYWADGSVYRTEAESFQQITYQRSGPAADQGTFVVFGKNGDIARYGSDADTRIPGAINGGVIGKWALSSVEDRLGYGYRITYVPGTGSEFPERIYYTLKPAQGGYGYASVELAYEPDQYGMSTAVLGRSYGAALRLSRITNRMNGAVAKQYFFNYEINAVTQRSLLSEVAECGVGSDCLQPTKFDWEKAASPNFSHATYIKFPGSPTTINTFQEGIYVPRFNGWVDINRDKFDDYCRISPIHEFNHSSVEVVCYLSDGEGNFSSQINIPTDLSGWRFIYNSNTSSYFNWNVDPSWMDIDNDGYVDLCYSRPLATNDKLECILNKSESGLFSKVISYEIPRAVPDKFRVGGRTWIDINGDSLADYCYDYMTSNGKKYVRCAIQKAGFEFEENVFTKEVSEIGGSWTDVNGDGLPDYCTTTSTKITCHINDRGQNINYAVWEKSGQNFKSDEPSTYTYPGATTRWFNAGFFDFTGNGYPDYCRIYRAARNGMHGYEAACLESEGTGWGNDVISAFMPLAPVSAGGISEDLLAEAVQFMDINNDGKVDWCIERGHAKQWHGADIKCFLGTAAGFGTSITSYTLPDLGVNQIGLRGLREINRGWADIYGDGNPRYCALYWKSNVPHNRGMACYGPQNSHRQDLLSSVENGQGLYYGVEYKDVSDPSVYSYERDVGPQRQIYVSSGMTVVAKLKASNGISGLAEQSYFYTNYGYMPDDRGGLGFDYERVISEKGNKRYEAWFSHDVSRHQAGQLLRSETAYQVAPGNFQVVSEEEHSWKTDIYFGDAFIINPLAQNIWNKNAFSLRYTVWPQRSTSRQYELDGELISTTVTLNSYYHGGLLSQYIATSGINQSSSKTLVNEYQDYPEHWMLGRLTRSRMFRNATYNGVASPSITRTSAWEYYPPSMPGIGGMLRKEIIEPDDPELRTEQHYTYNQFGAKASITSIYPGLPNQVVSYEYDPQGRFVTQEQNALGHTTSYGYDLVTGNKVTQTDANGLTAYWDYDAIGRLKTEISASGQRSQARIGSCITGCPAMARYYTESWLESSAGTRMTGSSIQYVDVLGRAIEAHSPGFSDETIIVSTQYDDAGEVARSSEPFVYGTQAYWNTIVSRDVLGRALEETTASGVQITTEYNAYTVEQTAKWNDPVSGSQISQTSVVVSDLNGNMRSATDAAQRTIFYHYDAYENLTRIDLPDQVQVENTYDVLGRRLTSNDPNIGSWNYAYDGAGRIALQENGSGRRVCFAYDQIGRMVGRVDDYLALSSWSVAKTSALNQCAGQAVTTSWTYDQTSKGVGRLALLQDSSGYSEEPFYDAFGRVLSVDIEYDDLELTSASTYDGATGRLTQETLLHEKGGTSVAIEYRYNSGGYLYEIGKPGLTDYYWRVTDKDARGQVTERSLANGMIQGRAEYHAASGFLQAMRAKVAYTSGWAIQNQSYIYDARGLMRQRAEHISSLNLHVQETFSYDSSNRLTDASVINMNTPAASYTQSASYDVSGNILSRNDVGAYVYGEACEANGRTYTPGPHAVTSISGLRNASYCYDGGGNMVSGDGRTVSYTSFNKPDQIQMADASVHFVYGPSRAILKTVTFSGTDETTKYSFGPYEKIIVTEQGQTSTRERFSLPGGAVISFEHGLEDSKKEEYLISDAIGSVIATVNALGGVSERYQYDPWGRPRASINWEAITDLTWSQIDRVGTATSKGFSGHEMLDQVGLIHMGGRVYDPTIGRFLSADPIVKGLENTESYNRYSYVLNSPLSFTDPSGYSWLSKTWKKIERSISRHFRAISNSFLSPIAISEAIVRYGGRALARFAEKNKFAGEVIGLVGMGACTALTMGSATGACVVGYQAITSGSMTYANGGSLTDALTAGLRSGALAYINISMAGGISEAGITNSYLKGAAHGIRGGLIAGMSGSDVRSGIVGGFAEGALGGGIRKLTGGDRTTGAVLAGFVSGAVSEVTGGKFAVGASTGAMGYLFNEMSGRNGAAKSGFADRCGASICQAYNALIEALSLDSAAALDSALVNAENIDNVFFHYTDRSGFAGAMSAGGVIRPGENGLVYLTTEMLSPREVHNVLFIGAPGYAGKGSHVFAIEVFKGAPLAPGSQANEFIHAGRLQHGRNMKILYGGKNPF